MWRGLAQRTAELRQSAIVIVGRIRPAFSRLLAKFWVAAHNVQQQASISGGGVLHTIVPSALIVLGLAFLIVAPFFQVWMVSLYSSDGGSPSSDFQNLRALAQGLGAAMIGVSGFAFTLVMFSMQTNLERVPHGLFRRLGGDARLWAAFVTAFLLATGIATLSLLQDLRWLGPLTLAGIWALAAVLGLLWYAYDRALTLVSPTAQLQLIWRSARRDFAKWSRRAENLRPLYVSPTDKEDLLDSPRLRFFLAHPFWTNGPLNELAYAASFARRGAERHDYEVSAAALDTIRRINGAYVEAKGRTFLAPPIIGDNPLASDKFINHVLETDRRELRFAIVQGDEHYISLLLTSFRQLCELYATIKYPSELDTKFHAQLAAGYLADGVEGLASHAMPDLLMEGIAHLGACSRVLLREGEPNEVGSPASRIATIALMGVLRADHRPVTREGMLELANLTVALLASEHADTEFAFGAVRKQVQEVAASFLDVPDVGVERNHSFYLSPYFSSVELAALPAKLVAMGNSAIERAPDDVAAMKFVKQLENFADGLAYSLQQLFAKAGTRQSAFAHDLIFFVCRLANVLAACSRWAKEDDILSDALENHAGRILRSSAWIGQSEEALALVSAYDFEGNIFETALDAKIRERFTVVEGARQAILDLAIAQAQHWRTADHGARGLLALAILAVSEPGIGRAELLNDLIRRLVQRAPPKEAAMRVAEELRNFTTDTRDRYHGFRPIEREMGKVAAREDLNALLLELAALFAPSE